MMVFDTSRSRFAIQIPVRDYGQDVGSPDKPDRWTDIRQKQKASVDRKGWTGYLQSQ